MITVVDYKLNNLRSIENTLRRLGHEVRVTSSPNDVRKPRRSLFFPALARFAMRWRNLRRPGSDRTLYRTVKSGMPTLGICLGMHLLFTESEEFGLHRGLDLFRAACSRLPEGFVCRIWAGISLHLKQANGLTKGIDRVELCLLCSFLLCEPAIRGRRPGHHGLRDRISRHRPFGQYLGHAISSREESACGERLLDNFARL